MFQITGTTFQITRIMFQITGTTFQITRITFQITRTTFQTIRTTYQIISQKHLRQQRRSQQLISQWDHPVQGVVEIMVTAVPEVGTAEDDN